MKYSQLLYDNLSSQKNYQSEKLVSSDIFSLLSAYDCEEVIGLYLQIALGYLLIPSSCKSDTLAYEYELIHRVTGEHAVVQVKTGGESLNRNDYGNIEGKVFVFASNGECFGDEYPHVTCLFPQGIENFMQDHLSLLPRKIQFWIRNFAPLVNLNMKHP